jgi:uncharacterized protein (TIGR00369 family)
MANSLPEAPYNEPLQTVAWLFDSVDRLYEKQPLSRMMSTTPRTFDSNANALQVDFLARDEHLNFMGVVHGGVLAAMIDEAVSIAAVCIVGWERFRGTVDTRSSYFQPVPAGPVRVTSRLVRQTSRLMFLEADLLIRDGVLCVRGSSIIAIAP